VETINNKLTKGTPFEMKPLRTIEIGNVEVSEKTLTLTIEDKPEITTRKATVEGVPDKEVLTLVADQQPISDAIIEEIPPLVIDSEDSDEEPLNVVALESEDEMIIAYMTMTRIVQEFDRAVD
jgi:hypothetical protein